MTHAAVEVCGSSVEVSLTSQGQLSYNSHAILPKATGVLAPKNKVWPHIFIPWEKSKNLKPTHRRNNDEIQAGLII